MLRDESGLNPTAALKIVMWVILLVCMSVARGHAESPFHSSPACWDGPRIYHEGAPEAELANRIKLIHGPPGATAREAVFSPNGGYRYWVRNPDTSQVGPWNATLTVDAEGNTRPTLLIEKVAGPIQPRWINEKLIFVRVTWGRIAFSDLILDVEKGKLIYHERATDGQIAYQQFQQGCNEKCPCDER